MGKYQENPPLPFVLGFDFSGVVEVVEKGVTRLKLGTKYMQLQYIIAMQKWMRKPCK